ncbi:MAG: aspartate aminotransferase family protein, partial [Tidjanibacter sp.]|nr:aspartate aminotransferase family protein [Tidjanibacter sp.]
MGLFDVYTLMDVEPAEARGLWITGADGSRYLDFYGGHAVISIGHSHPHYVERISTQLSRIGFYSNAVQNPLQSELAQLLGEVSGYPDYNLFLCNSGAEANENALKVASFVTGRDRVVAMRGAFHGRTSAAVAVTDNPSIQAPVNCGHKVSFVPLGDLDALEKEIAAGDVAAVMIEGIQGVGGIRVASDEFLLGARAICDKYGSMLLLDEVQSGYGRSGKFFAHQY